MRATLLATLLVICILTLAHARQSPPPAPTPSKTSQKQQHVRSSKPDKAKNDYANTQSSASPANNLSSTPPCCIVSTNATNNEGKKSATDWITVFTAVLAVVAVLQVCVLLMQWWIVWRQVDYFRNSERAWLIVTPDAPCQMQKVKNGYVEHGFGFDWKIKNCGKTPAFISKIGTRFHPVKSLSELPPEPNIDIRDLIQPTEQFENGPGIGPGESLERYTFTEAKRPESVPDYDAIRKGEISWVAYGIVTYRLSFSRESLRETRFCYLWMPGQQNPFTPSPIPREYTKQT